MNPRLPLLLALGLGLGRADAAEPAATRAPAPPAPAASAAAPARKPRASAAAPAPAPTVSFESFRLVGDRNIFNANRTGRRERSNEEPAPRLEVITLVGTMESDRGLRAFFDGSTGAFRKALRVGESVDTFKVTEVSPTVVALERDGKTLSMLVGQQLRRPAGGEWTLIGADIVRSEAAAAAAKAGEGKSDPMAPVAIPANADEVTRRLMEKRNKDLKK